MPSAAPKHGVRTHARKHHTTKPSEHEWLYDRKWRRARRVHLAANPLCEDCKAKGKLIAAKAIDHITPHRSDRDLFWDTTNWRSLCVPCHNRTTALYDGGFGRETKRKPIA